MIHTEAWICDWCGAAHKTEKTALECENKHQLNGDIVRRWFRVSERYPHEISIKFEDGKTINYDFSGEQDPFERY